MRRIEPEDLEGQIGNYVLLEGAQHGCIWILDDVEGDYACLKTQAGKRLMVGVERVCYTPFNDPGE